MKPNFDEMSKAELKAYVLSHRGDDEAIRVLFSRRNPPDSEATWYGPMCTPEGVPNKLPALTSLKGWFLRPAQ